MDKLKLYLDTCVISCLDQWNVPHNMAYTLGLWKLLKNGVYIACISDITIEELEKTPEPKRTFLFNELSEINFVRIKNDEEIVRLRDFYLRNAVLTEHQKNDLWHIASSVVGQCDVAVSWNMKHFANPRTIQRVNQVNSTFGYPAVQIVTPEIVVQWEELS
ncbi:MAG: PIN domain nuclease [Planctomycetia bacterium]|nr:PIN domain nuclease [Planctomycetia bacterium]